jgi:hypothetical protein
VVSVCSRPDISICGAVHVKLNLFICCLPLCECRCSPCESVGEVACTCHESMEVGESSIAALIPNLSTKGGGSGQCETSAPVPPGKELLYSVNGNLGGFRSFYMFQGANTYITKSLQ